MKARTKYRLLLGLFLLVVIGIPIFLQTISVISAKATPHCMTSADHKPTKPCERITVRTPKQDPELK